MIHHSGGLLLKLVLSSSYDGQEVVRHGDEAKSRRKGV